MVREKSMRRSWLRRARISAARVRTLRVRWPRASTTAGTMASLPIASIAPRAARRTFVGPSRSFRSSVSTARAESNRCRPAIAAITTLGLSLSRKRARVSKYWGSVHRAE